jgi:hypothetical protein
MACTVPLAFAGHGDKPLVLRPGVPIGFLGHPVGTLLTVQGRKAGLNTSLRVTSVNGRPLPKAVEVWTTEVLPDSEVTLTGYERPMMIGQAPAEVAVGVPDVNPHPWSLASQFVVLHPVTVPAEPGSPRP